jgi:multiple sugar transport system substrate-binding protein
VWAFGGAETDTTGKKVVLNSKGTMDSVKRMVGFWKDACDESALAWEGIQEVAGRVADICAAVDNEADLPGILEASILFSNKHLFKHI